MKTIKLEGLLMDNDEFICHGKSMWLTKEEIKKFVTVIEDHNPTG